MNYVTLNNGVKMPLFCPPKYSAERLASHTPFSKILKKHLQNILLC